jgi:hypothetical protein
MNFLHLAAADTAPDEWAVIVAIVLARLFVPLLIPRVPLLIIVALVLDAVDGSLLDAFTNVDVGPDGPYQSFDKALDIYYLAIAYLTMLRNWTSVPAFRIGQFLFYYRLAGVLAFELTGARAMLLLFPNTFEFYFIAYEAIRLRWDPARRSARFWLFTAAGLWIFVKLPQEYWIHVAQLDFTDAVSDHPWFGVLCALFVLALLAVLWFVVRPRAPAPDWDWRLAAEPLPEAPPPRAGVRWSELAEKAVLLALMSVIFAEILPSVTLSALEVTVGVAAIVCANTALSGRIPAFAARLVTNLGLIYLGSRVLSDAEDFPLGTGLFFAFLITLLISLYDLYKPVYEARAA